MIFYFQNAAYADWDFDRVPPTADQLTLMAHIMTDDLELAWERTNSITEHWSRNFKVIPHYKGDQVRSNVIGDVFFDGNMVYIVKGMGFEEWPEGITVCARALCNAVIALFPETQSYTHVPAMPPEAKAFFEEGEDNSVEPNTFMDKHIEDLGESFAYHNHEDSE